MTWRGRGLVRRAVANRVSQWLSVTQTTVKLRASPHLQLNTQSCNTERQRDRDRERETVIELSEDDWCFKELSDSRDLPDKFQSDAW